MNTVKEVLIAARKKIEKPENWTQAAAARDIQGFIVPAERPEAVCWCAIGSLTAVAWSIYNLYDEAYEALWEHTSEECQSVAVFNDTHTHADVLALFDKAIASAN